MFHELFTKRPSSLPLFLNASSGLLRASKRYRCTTDVVSDTRGKHHGDMAAEFSDAAAEAAKLALKMGSATADVIAFMADLGEDLPFLEPVLKTINAIRKKVNAVKVNREELAALEERCTYITAGVIERHSRTPNSEMDVSPLKNFVEDVESLVERCGGNRRGCRWRRLLRVSDDQVKIARLNARGDQLTGDLQLAGFAIMEGNVINLKAMLVSCYCLYHVCTWYVRFMFMCTCSY